MTPETPARAGTAARDAALARLRRLTGLTVGGAIVLTGAFAGIAASSTSGHKATALRKRVTPTRHSTSAPALPPPQLPSDGEQAAPAAPAAPPTSAPAPVAPAVVSGGS